MKRTTWLGLALSLAGTLGACGGSDLTCGEGTMEVNGSCVPIASDGGTGDGGTDSGLACGPGTVEMDGDCVPDGTVVCTDGTVFDDASGTCVLDESACGDGTMLVDGACVPEGLAEADVTEGDETNDPAYDGAPTAFVAPDAVDASTTLGGCIEPADFDGEEGVEPDVDAFAFSVTEPTVLRVRADGTGGLSPAFAVVPADAEALPNYFRVGLDFTKPWTERQLYLPAAGDYVLLVFDGRSLDLTSLGDGELRFATPAGSDSACYVVTVEKKAVPSATEVTDPAMPLSGTFGEVAAYRLAPSMATHYVLLGAAASNAAMVDMALHVGDATRTGSLLFSPTIGGTGAANLTFFVDHAYDYGFTASQWVVQIQTPGAAPADGDVTLTGSEGLGDVLTLAGEAGDVLHFAFDAGSEDVVVFLLDNAGNVVSMPCGRGFFGPNACSDAEVWLRLGAGTPYYAIIQKSGSPGPYDVAFTNAAQTPVAVSGAATNVTLRDGWTFLRADASAHKWSVLDLSGFMGTDFTAADVRFFEDTPGMLDFASALGLDGATAADRIFGPDMGGSLLIAIRDSDTFDGDEQVDATLGPQTFEDVVFTMEGSQSLSDQAIPAGGRLLLLVQAPPAFGLELTVTPSGSEDAVIDVLDMVGIPRSGMSVDANAGGGAEVLRAPFPESGWLALAVRTFDGTAGTVDIELTVTRPPYTVGMGTTAFSSICSSTTEVLDDDDALTSAIAWTSGFSFDFFGTATTGMVVSTNGWLTLDDTYTGSSRFSPALGSSTSPDAIVAPFWADLVSRICVQQAADRVTVEWLGRDFGNTGTVQMQAILYDDGRIEFVYGPDHDLPFDPDDVDVGIENQDATLTIPYEGTLSSGQAVLFTPAM